MLKLLPPYNVTIQWSESVVTTHESNRVPASTIDYDIIPIPHGLSGSLTPSIMGPLAGADIRDLQPTHLHSFGRISQNIQHVRVGNPNLISVPSFIPPSINDFNGLLANSTIFNSESVKMWNFVNPLTSLDSLFANCSSFNQDIQNWDVKNVSSMDSMFVGATSFDADLTCWNVEHLSEPVSFAPSLNASKLPRWGQSLADMTGRTGVFCKTIRSPASQLPLIYKPVIQEHSYAHALEAFNAWAIADGLTADPINLLINDWSNDDWCEPFELEFAPSIFGNNRTVTFSSEGGFCLYENVANVQPESSFYNTLGSIVPNMLTVERFYLATTNAPSLVILSKKVDVDNICNAAFYKANSTSAVMYAEYSEYGGTDNTFALAIRLSESGHVDVCTTNINSADGVMQFMVFDENTSSTIHIDGFGGFSSPIPQGSTVLYSSR